MVETTKLEHVLILVRHQEACNQIDNDFIWDLREYYIFTCALCRKVVSKNVGDCSMLPETFTVNPAVPIRLR